MLAFWYDRDKCPTAYGSGHSSILSVCVWSARQPASQNSLFVFEITIQRVDPRLKPSGMEIRQMISVTPDRTPEISNMQSRYLLSTLLTVCSAATSADNAGWQNARTPQTTNSASDHVQNASQNTGGVPATLVKVSCLPPGRPARWYRMRQGLILSSPPMRFAHYAVSWRITSGPSMRPSPVLYPVSAL